jgi:hypothetical protein
MHKEYYKWDVGGFLQVQVVVSLVDALSSSLIDSNMNMQ